MVDHFTGFYLPYGLTSAAKGFVRAMAKAGFFPTTRLIKSNLLGSFALVKRAEILAGIY